MKVGEKKTKEITINEAFTFLVEIERLPEGSGGMWDRGSEEYQRVRPYAIRVTSIGGDEYRDAIRVFGYNVKYAYEDLIDKAQHFIDSTSEIQEEEFLKTFK